MFSKFFLPLQPISDIRYPITDSRNTENQILNS